ncbi:tetratricopeptide repeat protein [Megasphaera elsdenii]|uniref:tetratricopeptide repeat protein n=1 Tax=Megasphaera elsdenii TaxID=907 RepID=UPI001D010AB2|nr:tetratricopeptide repeat protein [Megasphaera elsdenii]MCB5701876.1 tetratricopeptide repeat protein [Megasphaera elsdenii]MCB5726768.1 tetratricopeptide repeat protein [Megasphaera elsdenii]MCB5770547.1 tetratricopeptide repeat protein [Megasphaera elsdenii]
MQNKYLVILLLLALAAGSSGCGSQPSSSQTAQAVQEEQASTAPVIQADSQTYSDEGLKKYQAGDYAGAISDFDKALSMDAHNYQALSNKGVTLAMRGNSTGSKNDVAQGIELIEKALKIAPKDVASFYNLALAYKIDGQYDKALTYFKNVIAADPGNTWSYYGIATIYGDLGKADQALPYLKQAIDLGGEDVRQAARTQSHFDKIRNNKQFQQIVG